MQWSICLAYLDDIIVLRKNFDNHLNNMLGKLREAGLRLKLAKCALLQESVSYLGHMVSWEGVAIDPDKNEKVSASISKRSPKLSWTGNLLLKICQRFGTIANPLYKLTEQGRQFKWTTDCEASFATLKSCFTNTPIFSFQDYKRMFTPSTDASQEDIGAVLSQEQDG